MNLNLVFTSHKKIHKFILLRILIENDIIQMVERGIQT